MNSNKQVLFISRVLLLHEIATKRGGKSSAVRLSLGDWQSECDRCCFIGYVLECMEAARNDDGDLLFPGDIFTSMFQRAVEGFISSISFTKFCIGDAS